MQKTRTVERWERGLFIKCHRGQRRAKCAGDTFRSVFLLQDEALYVINRDELAVIFFLILFFYFKSEHIFRRKVFYFKGFIQIWYLFQI